MRLLVPLFAIGLCLASSVLGSSQSIAAFRFQSKNFPGRSIGLTGNAAYIKSGNGNRFVLITPGLTGTPGTVSFQSVDRPNRYLRHRDFLLFEDPFLEQQLYRQDATFIVRPDHYFQGYAAFQSVNYPNRFIRHQGYRLKLHPGVGTPSTLFKNDASFCILGGLPFPNLNQATLPTTFASQNFPNYKIGVNNNNEAFIIVNGADEFRLVSPGLTGQPGTVSFESASRPRHYLRHAGFLIFLHPYSDTALYRNDATFKNLDNHFFQGYTAFESVNYPNRFIRHQGYRLKLHTYDGSNLFKKDASFQSPAVPATYSQKLGPFSFPSQNFPQKAIGVKFGNQGWLIDNGDKYYIITPGLSGQAGTMSFESASTPGRYLRHSGFLIFLNWYQATDLFKKDASFYPQDNKYFTAFAAFQSQNYPNRYIRHQNYRLKLHPDDGTPLMHKDASYKIKADFPLQPMSRRNAYSIKSFNYPAYSMALVSNQGRIVLNTPDKFYITSPGLCGLQGTVSFQRVNQQGRFLRNALGGVIDALPYEDNDQYKLATCFYARYNKYHSGFTAYESAFFPNHFIRHQGFRLKLHVEDQNDALYRADTSFRPVL